MVNVTSLARVELRLPMPAVDTWIQPVSTKRNAPFSKASRDWTKVVTFSKEQSVEDVEKDEVEDLGKTRNDVAALSRSLIGQRIGCRCEFAQPVLDEPPSL